MMGKERIGLEAAERQLDRLMGFFPRIDSKLSALFAILSGQVAIALVNLSYNHLAFWWVALPAAIFASTSIYTMYHLYQCAFPSLVGGAKSLVYFKEIASLREADFINKYTSLSEDELHLDVVAQVWRNAEIVAVKFDSLKMATRAVMLGTLPWALILLASILHSSKLLEI